MQLKVCKQFRNLRSFIPIDAQTDLGFLGAGCHLLHSRGICKNLSFWLKTSVFFFYLFLFHAGKHGIPIQPSHMWTIQSSVNIISILTGEVGLWLDAPVVGIHLSSILVLGRVGKLYKQISFGNLKPCWQNADPELQLRCMIAQRTFYMTLILQRSFYSPESLRRNDYVPLAWWSRILTSSSGISLLISFNMKQKHKLVVYW